MKYKIIKFLDIAGLKVFEPVVRLATMEEPGLQLKKIFQFILIPIIAFFTFIVLWNYVAPRHTTKSGEVPTPPVVMDAWSGILKFHEWENQKEMDFQLTGKRREEALLAVQKRLTELEPLIVESDKKLSTVTEQKEAYLAKRTKPVDAEYDKLKEELSAASKKRSDELKVFAESIKPEEKEKKMQLLDKVREERQFAKADKEKLNLIKDKLSAIRNETYTAEVAILKENNRLVSERQYLRKRQDLLNEDNRDMKVKKAKDSIKDKEDIYLAATGTSLISKAKSLVRKEESMSRIESSKYAKPMTFLDQIIRSLGCVFLGFAIAVVIAIPIGIFCGLNQIFMASMVPLISLFKPVSPIVWLPIVFIIVGGFIDDPENASVHPAFLSSAITVALCSLWPTLVNTALGVSSIEKDYLNVAKVLKLGFWSRLFKIIIPSALPLIFAGLRISLGVGWMVLIAAELLSSSEGIGKFVWDMFNNGSSETFAQMFVVVFIVGIVGLLLDRIMIVLQRSVSFGETGASL